MNEEKECTCKDCNPNGKCECTGECEETCTCGCCKK